MTLTLAWAGWDSTDGSLRGEAFGVGVGAWPASMVGRGQGLAGKVPCAGAQDGVGPPPMNPGRAHPVDLKAGAGAWGELWFRGWGQPPSTHIGTKV